MLIAVVNQSTKISDADVNTMCQGIQIQLDLNFLPAWGLKSCTIKFYKDQKSVPGYAWLFTIIDSNAQVQDALGWHEEDNGRVTAFIACDPILENHGVVLFDPTQPQNVSVSSVLSHECLEAIIDRSANGYVDNGTTSWALEVADPVEGCSYMISVNGVSVSVSNFVFPSFFNPEATSPINAPFDFCLRLNKPFSLDKGGYAITRTGGPGSETQIFGELMPKWKRDMKKSELSRFARRRGKLTWLQKLLAFFP